MSDNTPSLGGRLKLLPPDKLRPDQKKLHDAIMERMVPWAEESGFQAATGDGKLLGPFNPMLYSPMLGQASLEGVEAERQHTSLNKRVREIIILTVGEVWRAAYELYAHTAVAEKAGLDEHAIQAIKSGHIPEGLSEEETVAHEFTHMLVSEHKVDAKMYARGVAVFGEKGLVDLIFLAGNYITVSALLNAFEVPVPPPAEPPPTVEAE